MFNNYSLSELRSVRNLFAEDNVKLRAETFPAQRRFNQRYIDNNIKLIHNITEVIRGLVFAPHAN